MTHTPESRHTSHPSPSSTLPDTPLIEKVLSGKRIKTSEAEELYHLPLPQLGILANARRELAKAHAYQGQGNSIVTYIIDRNINYTNVCNVYCKFCAFYRTEKDTDHYVLTPDQISEKIRELEAIGGVQILLQGGHHPSLGLDYYLTMLSTIRSRHPTINIHGFSAPEIHHFSEIFHLPTKEILRLYKEAGLGSLPGGGGEILTNAVRHRISPLKCDADTWLRIMREAHEIGLRSSSTMMFGHIETLHDRLEHLERLRDLQDQTGGFTAFICWTFQPDNTVLKAKKVGAHEYLRMQALSRIFLDNIENIQSSWVTQGPQIGQIALSYGANDFGSIMMEENVVSSAGTSFRLTVEEMEHLIRSAGYTPRRRNNWYQLL